MSKFTPGPWRVTDVQVSGWVDIYAEDRALPVASTRHDQAAANAQLIAAAPDLLDALKFVLSATGEQLTSAFEQAEAAITKATRGQQ